MRLDQEAIRVTDGARGHVIAYLPLDDTLTITWPDATVTYPADGAVRRYGPVRLVPRGHGPSYDLDRGCWDVRYHDTGPHRPSYRCHDGIHWRVHRAGDAATAAQIWADRDKISNIVRESGERDVPIVVRYRDDYAAILHLRSPHTFLGAFTYPPGQRHRPAEPRHRRPPTTVPDGTRLPLAALPVGALIDAPRALADGTTRWQTLLVRTRRGPRTLRPGRPAPQVTLSLARDPDGQRCDPADEVLVTDRTYQMDHWPHTLPDPTPTH